MPAKKNVCIRLGPSSLRAIDYIRREYFLDTASAAVRLALGREAARLDATRPRERTEAAEVSHGR